MMEKSFTSSAPANQRAERESLVKRVDVEQEDEMRAEYDLSELKGRVRGKYVERYRAGTNLT